MDLLDQGLVLLLDGEAADVVADGLDLSASQVLGEGCLVTELFTLDRLPHE